MMQVSGRKRHPLVMKFQQPGFYKNIVVNIVKYILLVGLCFIILYPFIKKFSTAFMSQADIADPTVQYLPRNPTLFNFKTVIEQTGYFQALFNTAVMSLGMGLRKCFFARLSVTALPNLGLEAADWFLLWLFLPLSSRLRPCLSRITCCFVILIYTGCSM